MNPKNASRKGHRRVLFFMRERVSQGGFVPQQSRIDSVQDTVQDLQDRLRPGPGANEPLGALTSQGPVR